MSGEDKKLPEEFAPTGPKLSRFPIQPAPPIVPRLFPDERAFALRLAVLCGASELCAWAALVGLLLARGRAGGWLQVAALGAGLRALRLPVAHLAARVGRPLLVAALLLVAAAAQVAALASGAHGLVPAAWAALCVPVLGDVAASTVADAVTVERRAAALAALDGGAALGCALGAGLAAAFPAAIPAACAAALLLGLLALRDLRDRGTPRSAWPLGQLLATTRALAGAAVTCALTGLLAGAALAAAALRGPALAWLLAPLAGMALVARLEPWLGARGLSLAVCLCLASGAFCAGGLGEPGLDAALALVALGATAAAIPASVLRGAAELDRPLASSALWTALSLGAGTAALLSALPVS